MNSRESSSESSVTNPDKKKAFIIDDINQIQEVEIEVDPQNPTRVKAQTLEGATYLIHKDYVYTTREDAVLEIEHWHSNLHQALKHRDLIACLSIQKQPERRLKLGLSPKEIQEYLDKDRKNYKLWRQSLEKRWSIANEGKFDGEALIKTLRKSIVIKDALEDPMAKEFIEIVAGELRLETTTKPNHTHTQTLD